MKKRRTLVIITFIVIISIKLCVIFMRKTQAFKDDCNDVSQVSFDLSSNNSGKSDDVLVSTNSSNFSTLEMSNLTHGNPELLSRKKRYILFPDGSTFTVSKCCVFVAVFNINTCAVHILCKCSFSLCSAVKHVTVLMDSTKLRDG